MRLVFFLFFLMCSLPVAQVVGAQTAEQIREAQFRLTQAGFEPGPVDGLWGRRTQDALVAFLKEQGAVYDGALSDNELVLLREAPPRASKTDRVHTSNGRKIKHRTSPNGMTDYPDYWELPQYLDLPPNDVTLSRYFQKWLSDRNGSQRYQIEPAGNATAFASTLRTSDYLQQQLSYKSVLCYLYFEGGEIVYDGLAPQERFSFQLDDTIELRSQSVGKSLVSYLVGHAICQGYIDTVNVPLSDRPLINDTLYAQRTLLEVLNMRAQDQHVVTEEDGFLQTGRWFNNSTVKSFAGRELAGTQPNRRVIYNYNGFATIIAMNYVIFKTGDDWDAFLNSDFQDHIGIERNLFFSRQRVGEDADGPARYMFYAARYDHLRIAETMLEDWQSENCLGQYLRDIYAARQPKNHRFNDPNRMSDVAKSYGGQFHFDFQGMRSRTVFGFNGYGGQNIAIDMDAARIVVVNAAHTNYDWRALVYNAIKNGTLPD